MTPFTRITNDDDADYISHWHRSLAFTIAGLAQFAAEALTTPGANDAVRARLLPTASTHDRNVAAEFRKLAGAQIAGTKATAVTAFGDRLVTAIADSDGDVVTVKIPADEARETLAAISTLRLAVAEMLRVESDADAELVAHQALAGGPVADANSEHAAALMFMALGAAQESLLNAMGYPQ